MIEKNLRNLAKEHAKLFKLEPIAEEESAVAFRERVARALEELGQNVYAHEVLMNQRMSGDPFAKGSLDRGYGSDYITKMAEMAEASYQHELKIAQGGIKGMLAKIFG